MSDNSLGARLKRSFDAFFAFKETAPQTMSYGYGYNPIRTKLKYGNERTIMASIMERIATDAAAIPIKHVRVDQNGRFKEEIKDDIDLCLNLNANIDQTGREFIHDCVLSMLDEGVVGVVPTVFDANSIDEDGNAKFEIFELRVGKIVEWYPKHVKVELYNQDTGRREQIVVPKAYTAILENPFYSVMNEHNSTLKRLIRKLALLDITDETNSSGKLDMIIQLPYVVKSEARRKQAEQRRNDIEMQLAGSKYGIAYTDGTERITQLNRSVENQLLTQVEKLTNQLYSQLGMTEEILKGTANEQTLLNYNNQVIEPVLSTITNAFTWKYLTKTARSQGQSFMFFRDPFKLVPVNNIADIADKFTRNEILSSNEVRGLIGFMPVDNPQANELRNKNINQSADAEQPAMTTDGEVVDDAETQDITETEVEAKPVYDDEGNLVEGLYEINGIIYDEDGNPVEE